MKNKTLGELIKKARVYKGLTRESAAKKLGITSGYLAHLERNSSVHLSDRLASGLIDKIGVSKRIKGMQEKQNNKARKYYSDFRAKR